MPRSVLRLCAPCSPTAVTTTKRLQAHTVTTGTNAFAFDEVIETQSEADVYQVAAQNDIAAALQCGADWTLLAYGPGSGDEGAMGCLFRPPGDADNGGLLPRGLQQVVAFAKQANSGVMMELSGCIVLREVNMDLLRPAWRVVEREDDGLKTVPVTGVDGAVDVLNAMAARAKALETATDGAGLGHVAVFLHVRSGQQTTKLTFATVASSGASRKQADSKSALHLSRIVQELGSGRAVDKAVYEQSQLMGLLYPAFCGISACTVLVVCAADGETQQNVEALEFGAAVSKAAIPGRGPAPTTEMPAGIAGHREELMSHRKHVRVLEKQFAEANRGAPPLSSNRALAPPVIPDHLLSDCTACEPGKLEAWKSGQLDRFDEVAVSLLRFQSGKLWDEVYEAKQRANELQDRLRKEIDGSEKHAQDLERASCQSEVEQMLLQWGRAEIDRLGSKAAMNFLTQQVEAAPATARQAQFRQSMADKIAALELEKRDLQLKLDASSQLDVELRTRRIIRQQRDGTGPALPVPVAAANLTDMFGGMDTVDMFGVSTIAAAAPVIPQSTGAGGVNFLGEFSSFSAAPAPTGTIDLLGMGLALSMPPAPAPAPTLAPPAVGAFGAPAMLTAEQIQAQKIQAEVDARQQQDAAAAAVVAAERARLEQEQARQRAEWEAAEAKRQQQEAQRQQEAAMSEAKRLEAQRLRQQQVAEVAREKAARAGASGGGGIAVASGQSRGRGRGRAAAAPAMAGGFGAPAAGGFGAPAAGGFGAPGFGMPAMQHAEQPPPQQPFGFPAGGAAPAPAAFGAPAMQMGGFQPAPAAAAQPFDLFQPAPAMAAPPIRMMAPAPAPAPSFNPNRMYAASVRKSATGYGIRINEDARGNAVVEGVDSPAAQQAGVRVGSVFMVVGGTPVGGRGRAGVIEALQQPHIASAFAVDFMFAAPA